MEAESISQQTLNNQDKLPFIPEYELVHEGGPSTDKLFDNCKKNPGHPNFIPVKQLKIEDLPEEHRTDEVMDFVRHMCDRTVRIVIKYTSKDRPDNYMNSDIRGSSKHTLFGTGYRYREVERVQNERCPCRNCEKSDDPKMGYLLVWVLTARHVIFDESEAKHAVVEFFYDSENRNEVIQFHGVWATEVDEGSRNLDMSLFLCVSHEIELVKKVDTLSAKLPEYQNGKHVISPFPFIVSHPHGRSKQFTIGNNIHHVQRRFISSQPKDQPLTFEIEAGSKCRLSKIHWATSLELFEQLVDSDMPCEPGVVYRIKRGLTLSSNSSTILSSLDLLSEIYQDPQKFVRFPSSVEFSYNYGNDNNSNSFPDVEFEMNDDELKLVPKMRDEFHNEYDINTCAGSSGAAVCGSGIYDGPLVFWFCHAGWDSDHRMNRTGRSEKPAPARLDSNKRSWFSCALL